MHELAAKSAGKPLSWKFSEYTQELINAAQVFDGGNTHTTNPRVKTSVNQTELIFDDGVEFVDCDYETNVHSVDTPIEELMVAQAYSAPNRRSRRKVLLNRTTWGKLSQQDRDAWDLVSEEGKASIIRYAGQRRSPPSNDRPDTTPFQHQTNTHELETPSDEQTHGPPHLQVSTHEQRLSAAELPKAKVQFKPGPSLLHMATTKTTPSPGMDINLHLSQKTKPKLSTDISKNVSPVEVTHHETHEREYTSYTHEVIVTSEKGESSPHELISFGEDTSPSFTFMLDSMHARDPPPLQPSTSASTADPLDFSGLQLLQQHKD